MRTLFILIGLIPFTVQAEAPDALLAKTVAQLNKHTPLTLDGETRLDGVSGKNKVLTYDTHWSITQKQSLIWRYWNQTSRRL